MGNYMASHPVSDYTWLHRGEALTSDIVQPFVKREVPIRVSKNVDAYMSKTFGYLYHMIDKFEHNSYGVIWYVPMQFLVQVSSTIERTINVRRTFYDQLNGYYTHLRTFLTHMRYPPVPILIKRSPLLSFVYDPNEDTYLFKFK